jgi:hypothetical protein
MLSFENKRENEYKQGNIDKQATLGVRERTKISQKI